jgi:hypothetical protein
VLEKAAASGRVRRAAKSFLLALKLKPDISS